MLKGLSVLFVLTVGLVTFSCKKNYSCDCTWTDGGKTYSVSHEIKARKKKAKEECSAEQDKFVKNANKEKVYWRCMLNK